MSTAVSEHQAPAAPSKPQSLALHASAGKAARDRRRRLLRNVRQGLFACLILAALVAAVMALRPTPVPVDVASVTSGPLSLVIEEDGVTRVKDRFVVSAPVTGSIARVTLEPGDEVKEGDAVVEIAPSRSPLLDERTRAEAEARLGAALSTLGQASAQVSRAQVGSQQAEQDLARTKQLYQAGSLAFQAFEQAEFSARMRTEELASAEFAKKIANEEVRIARVALGKDGAAANASRHIDVIAPVSGRILRVHQKSAGVVQASTPLVEIGDPQVLEVVVDLLTTDAVHVGPGTPVVIRGWGGDRPIAARVRRVEPSAFTRPSALGVDEQRVNVVVAFTEPRELFSALGDGYRVEARLVLWQADKVLKVPQGAVFRHGDGWAVFLVQDGRAELVPVKVGHRGETEAEISSGLSQGAKVVVHPGDRVKSGERVEARALK
ncbi:MAG TPA: HlyD family efflux transporter periplasmic adaptor subunit [Polyangiaceae bacterium]|nr:HlyD family efflux transporter periplasmic adaptor subunit [Polyangiaceae bacterium]